MNIIWRPDPANVGLLAKDLPVAFGEMDPTLPELPDEHFVLRTRPNGPDTVWMVDYRPDYTSAPVESVVSGTSPNGGEAQRRAIKAMLDLIDGGTRPTRDQHMTDEQVAAAIAVYDDGVRAHQAGLTVAGLDGGNTSDIEIFYEVLVEAGLAGLVGPGFLDTDTEGRLEAAVTAYRESLRQHFAANIQPHQRAGVEQMLSAERPIIR